MVHRQNKLAGRFGSKWGRYRGDIIGPRCYGSKGSQSGIIKHIVVGTPVGVIRWQERVHIPRHLIIGFLHDVELLITLSHGIGDTGHGGNLCRNASDDCAHRPPGTCRCFRSHCHKGTRYNPFHLNLHMIPRAVQGSLFGHSCRHIDQIVIRIVGHHDGLFSIGIQSGNISSHF